MKHDQPIPSPAIVVGIDGSSKALTAVLWAVDEAVSRDIPLRLIYAIEPRTSPLRPEQTARDLATADIAVREAFMAVESLEQPVKVEVEIVQDRAEHALVTAAMSATMVCVGALGRDHALGLRVGSVAALVSRSAHCPVAIIRNYDPLSLAGGWVVAEVDDSPDSNQVLECALEEARLRDAALKVVAAASGKSTADDSRSALSESGRLSRASLEKRLEQWRRRFPDIDITAVAPPGGAVNYVAANAPSIQLLVVGQQRNQGLNEIAGPAAHSALRATNSSVMICGQRGML